MLSLALPQKMYLVYCVLEAGQGIGSAPRLPTSLAGVDGQPVCLMEHDGLIAAASQHADQAGGLDPDLSRIAAYERVLEILGQHRAILPFRYGCLLKDESQVIDLLRKHHHEYRAVLRELEGCVEMSVCVILKRARRKLRRDPPPVNIPPYSPGKAYLLTRRRHYAAEERIIDVRAGTIDRYQAAFAGLFVRCKAEYRAAPGSAFPHGLLSLSFLVKREGVAAFRQAFRSLSAREAAQILLSGPWPPHNFTQPATNHNEVAD